MLKSEKHYSKVFSAFTLIELIIVITIIGMLTSIIVRSYNGSIQHSRVESSGEELKSLIETLRSKADSGIYIAAKDQKNTSVAVCYGMYIKNKEGKPLEIKTFATKFDSEKGDCEYTESSWQNTENIDVFKDIKLNLVSEIKLDEIKIFFYPTKGDMKLTYSDENIEYNETIKITLNHVNYTNFSRTLILDPTLSTVILSK